MLSGVIPTRGKPYFERVAIPVTSYVTDKKAIVFYNIIYYLTWVVSIVYFVFFTKGWTEPVKLSLSTTMWADPSESLFGAGTSYCNNPDFNYYHFDDWRTFIIIGRHC